jgi:hypothetical protein
LEGDKIKFTAIGQVKSGVKRKDVRNAAEQLGKNLELLSKNQVKVSIEGKEYLVETPQQGWASIRKIVVAPSDTKWADPDVDAIFKDKVGGREIDKNYGEAAVLKAEYSSEEFEEIAKLVFPKL